MNGFFKLIQQFTTQGEPAYCGISSLVQVMNALEIDPKRTWKGAWRWYSEDMLDCCRPLDEVRKVRTRSDCACCLVLACTIRFAIAASLSLGVFLTVGKLSRIHTLYC